MGRRKTSLAVSIGFGAIGLGISLASVAFACTSQLPISVSPALAPPMSAVTVSGGSTPGSVELHWDAVDGPVLATTPAGSAFAQGVRVPDAAPGVHTIVAVTRANDGTVTSKGVVSMEVAPGPGTRTAPVSGWGGSSRGAAANQVVAGGGSGGSQLALGVGLLAVGTVVLFAGFATAEVRRRKALVGVGAPR